MKRYAAPSSKTRNSRAKSFLKFRSPFCNLNIDGEDFYKSVRCALLHETQTKQGWKILANGYEKSIDNKTIYRNNFQRDIEKALKNYKESIVYGLELKDISTFELRENFIAKFNNICKTSIDNENI